MEQPLVVVLTGAPASGKSVTGAAYARLTGAALLDQDTLTNPLVDVVAGLLDVHDYADPRLAAATRDARYECLLRVAEDCLRVGVPVVLVAPFTTERRDAAAWGRLAARMAAAGGRARLAWLRVAPDELERRLVGRGAARDAAKLADVRAWVAGLDLAAPAVPFVEVDAAAEPAEQADALRAALA
ncbi:AAA family ATPase [Cellulomonas endophytica]|uniref:AAA family ATPase n=1 Tax=Cellulomonas endophytica TaxID=2494735 RepID=UPI0013E93B99|nr:AAA family ATPase [Cellulomonas endophytica]